VEVTGRGVAVWGDADDTDAIWARLDSYPPTVRHIACNVRDAAVASPGDALHDVYRRVLASSGVDVPPGRWDEPSHATFGSLGEVMERWVASHRFNSTVVALDAAGVPLTLVGRGFERLHLGRGHVQFDSRTHASPESAVRSVGAALLSRETPDFLDIPELGLMASGVALLAPPTAALKRLFDRRGGHVFLSPADGSSLPPGVAADLLDAGAMARRSVLAKAAAERHFGWAAVARGITDAATKVLAGPERR
jgi:hypothetical protein